MKKISELAGLVLVQRVIRWTLVCGWSEKQKIAADRSRSVKNDQHQDDFKSKAF